MLPGDTGRFDAELDEHHWLGHYAGDPVKTQTEVRLPAGSGGCAGGLRRAGRVCFLGCRPTGGDRRLGDMMRCRDGGLSRLLGCGRHRRQLSRRSVSRRRTRTLAVRADRKCNATWCSRGLTVEPSEQAIEDSLAADLSLGGGVVSLTLQGGTELDGGLEEGA